MPEFRPDPNELIEVAKNNLATTRRIALAVGGALLAFGLCKSFHVNVAFLSAATAAMGAAIIGFFSPAWPQQQT